MGFSIESCKTAKFDKRVAGELHFFALWTGVDYNHFNEAGGQH
jgi:hypothetical protein